MPKASDRAGGPGKVWEVKKDLGGILGTATGSMRDGIGRHSKKTHSLGCSKRGVALSTLAAGFSEGPSGPFSVKGTY